MLRVMSATAAGGRGGLGRFLDRQRSTSAGRPRIDADLPRIDGDLALTPDQLSAW
jgi:hypothetical protein